MARSLLISTRLNARCHTIAPVFVDPAARDLLRYPVAYGSTNDSEWPASKTLGYRGACPEFISEPIFVRTLSKASGESTLDRPGKRRRFRPHGLHVLAMPLLAATEFGYNDQSG